MKFTSHLQLPCLLTEVFPQLIKEMKKKGMQCQIFELTNSMQLALK